METTAKFLQLLYKRLPKKCVQIKQQVEQLLSDIKSAKKAQS